MNKPDTLFALISESYDRGDSLPTLIVKCIEQYGPGDDVLHVIHSRIGTAMSTLRRERDEIVARETPATTRYYQQATTGTLHAVKSCSITSRTRYSHFDVDLTDVEAAKYARCAKCFDVEKPAPTNDTHPTNGGDMNDGTTTYCPACYSDEHSSIDECPHVWIDSETDVRVHAPVWPGSETPYSTADAYDFTQTNDAMRDGDVVVCQRESDDGPVTVYAVLVEAWPVAFDGLDEEQQCAPLHTLDDVRDLSTIDDGKYARTFDVAERYVLRASA